MNNKEILLNNIIGLNPTGILDFNGTYNMNGANNIVQNANNISKENLKKTNHNQIVCNNIENFENYKKKYNYKIIYIILFLLFIFLIYFSNLFKKKYFYII